MQTLTTGSFLNLENSENVEAVKFTARRLAEMTTTFVTAENLTAEKLKNLANDLWQKAEYVARETERRRFRAIFARNFSERFRELKPEVSAAEITSVEVRQNIPAAGNNDSTAPSSETVETASMPDLPKGRATGVEGKKDDFLGFVESGEPFVESPVTETQATTPATPLAPEKPERETIQHFRRESDGNAGELRCQARRPAANRTRHDSFFNSRCRTD